jgi:hypothetical protein
MEETIRHAKCLYDQQRRRLNFQKSWEETIKIKVEQRKKGDKPPFFINTAQGQPTPNEPRMTETVGKNSRKQPIQCWGCGRDHMHRDFPQGGEKVRTSHSVKQTAIVEDMGRNVPKIYAALDNKQAHFQSHVIEVEGKINDQPIVILINSVDSHNHLDPNMV